MSLDFEINDSSYIFNRRVDLINKCETAINAVIEESEKCKSCDPLNLNCFFKSSLTDNLNNNLEFTLKDINNKVSEISALNFNHIESLSIIRDLGMILASANTLKINLNFKDKIEFLLSEFGTKCLEVPRDTVYSYGPRNPSGENQRRFTSLDNEVFFIQSFSKSIDLIYKAIISLIKSTLFDHKSLEFTDYINQAAESINQVSKIMANVYLNVPPHIFTNYLRSFFEPIKINSVDYLAAGGAQMPFLFIDYILWGYCNKESWYQLYLNENIQYQPYQFKNLFKLMFDSRDILTNYATKESLIYLEPIYKKIISFRTVHLKVAKENFLLRNHDSLGSGGYTTEILEELLKSTIKNVVSKNG